MQTHYLECQLDKLSKAGPVVLITHGSDMTATDALAKKMPPNVVKWFSVNCGTKLATALPIGLRSDRDHDALLSVMRGVSRTDGGRLAYYCATWNTPNLRSNIQDLRRNLRERFAREPWATVKGGSGIDDVPFDEYVADISSHKYVICPVGACPDTHRAWEAMYLGAIPVVQRCTVTERFGDMPFLFVDDWSQVTESWLVERYDEMRERLARCGERLTASYWLGKINESVPIS